MWCYNSYIHLQKQLPYLFDAKFNNIFYKFKYKFFRVIERNLHNQITTSSQNPWITLHIYSISSASLSLEKISLFIAKTPVKSFSLCTTNITHMSWVDEDQPLYAGNKSIEKGWKLKLGKQKKQQQGPKKITWKINKKYKRRILL